VSILMALVFQARLLNVRYLNDVVATSPLDGDYWKLVTQLFVYWPSTSYEVAALAAIFLFGWLLERRHGKWAPLLVFFVGGVAGSAAVLAIDPQGGTMGANSAALALLAAWSMRDILARRRGEEDDADLLGVLAIAVVLVLLPVASPLPNSLAGLTGGVVGILLGLLLARVPQR
jgi:membrane associated rhomboid family serine protease